MKKCHLKFKFLISLFVLVCSFSFAQTSNSIYSFRLKNTTGYDRIDELVDVNVQLNVDLNNVCLLDEFGRVVPFEISNEGTIRFLASVTAYSTSVYYLDEGTRVIPNVMTYANIKIPSTRADIAWENNLCAYRMYSTVLLNSEPNTAQGVDVWQKKTSDMVIDKMYSLLNYHNESNYGMDVYSVNGKRLGCGGTAAIVNGHLVMHSPYNSCDFLEQSALKQKFKLTYDNILIDGEYYKKTVVIECYANSILNKATVKLEGKESDLKLAVGIYDHTDMGISVDGKNFTEIEGLVGRAELKSEGSVTTENSRFYQGIYVPYSDVATEEIDNHVCLVVNYKVGTELTYFFGAGWNHFPVNKFPNDEDWFCELEMFKIRQENPLTVTGFNKIPNKDDVLYILNSVNQTWQNKHPNHGDFFWNRAVYYIGNMHAYEVTQNKDYLDYATEWAEQNNWRGREGDSDPTNWKWTYGESYNYVLFGDNQVCFQVYADLYNLDPNKDYLKIARAIEVMEYEINTDEEGYIWWVDGLFMVMPIMTKLYNITGNSRYLDKMYVYWKWYSEQMFDYEENLYYRDANYVYPQHKTIAGKKDFWSRGNGWIFATFAKIIQDLPLNDLHRDEYIDYYKKMAFALKQCQQKDGYWERSLIDSEQAPGYETSGTAFFAYGFAWGIYNGILSEVEYGKTLENAWNYLSNIAYQPDATVGYIQPIGSAAVPGQTLYSTSYYDFGVGAFLMAASEISKLAVGDTRITKLRLTDVDIDERDEINLIFNCQLDSSIASNGNNYYMNNEVPDIKNIYVNNNIVTVILNEPIDYGCYRFEVKNLLGINGEKLADKQYKTIVLPVPLIPASENMSVIAIGAQNGNPAINVLDNNFSTRWSQEGLGQWIQIDLGNVYEVEAVDIAFYNGNVRIAYFDILTSQDGVNFNNALINTQSSGLTDQLEHFKINPINARYVRIVGNGTSQGLWNSITEIRVRVSDYSIDRIELPRELYSDILLPQTTDDGNSILWTSSDKNIMSGTGIVQLQEYDQKVTLTANVGRYKKTFDFIVKARNPYENLQLLYLFDNNDVYDDNGFTYIVDHSKYARDAIIRGTYGSVHDGLLDLTANKPLDDNNGYLVVPPHLLDSLRSYTVAFVAKPESVNRQPRFYDFGYASSNSIFLRANKFSVGYKYNGETTTLVNASAQINVGEEQRIAVTFDARTMITKIYLNGKCVAEDNKIVHEPHEITKMSIDNRNYIGRTQWWDTSVAADNYDYQGTIDQFYLFSMPLNDNEIKKLFDNYYTNISSPEHDLLYDHDYIYDLSGRKLNSHKLNKGIYIINGKKIFIK